MALNWILDDMVSLISFFEKKKIEQFYKNPVKLNGENLQWDGYYIPYYDSPEDYQRVRELLQQAGIFSINVQSHEEKNDIRIINGT